ncbi:MAG: hypothetical protein Kow001_15180 [Acidobacteriota bacterium]
MTPMRPIIISVLSFGLGAGSLVASSDPASAGISGDYLEVRTADVWTGPCFANGEVNLAGKEAILAWHVREGAWNSVDLADLKVVAVIRSASTLGDPFAPEGPVHSAIVVDARANETQRGALVDFVRHMGGELVQDVVWVKQAPIDMEILRESGSASLTAGDFVAMRTRALNHHDMHCGNESVYYPPLTEVTEATPAFALDNSFTGEGLGAVWNYGGKRSAFIGTFAR